MQPTLREIVRYRYLATLVVRVVGLIFLVIGVMFIILWIIEGVKDNDILMFGYYGLRIVIGVSLTTVGAMFVFLGRWLVRWLTPIPEPSCPRCGYALHALESPRCPECGLGLGDRSAPVGEGGEFPAHPPLAMGRSPDDSGPRGSGSTVQ
jgi:hypothetical protein